ncbi:MAG: CoA transferase [Acidimicrobiales bacterium]
MKRLPFEGLRVADLSHFWAGPAATVRLAELGAEVWKVESPSAWDNGRTLLHQPGVETPWESSYWFQAWHRDKKSVTLDLARPRGASCSCGCSSTATCWWRTTGPTCSTSSAWAGRCCRGSSPT